MNYLGRRVWLAETIFLRASSSKLDQYAISCCVFGCAVACVPACMRVRTHRTEAVKVVLTLRPRKRLSYTLSNAVFIATGSLIFDE